MYLSKFVHSETGRYLMSVILGLGLATFFRQICSGKKCVVSKAPPLEEIEDKIYKFDGKCYKMEKNVENCTKGKKIVAFA
uniref:Uncharacterized protein n=1 Tax=viral metagenome TaxID=1070528 RepID=A0A6C0I8B3_9ZZZZ